MSPLRIRGFKSRIHRHPPLPIYFSLLALLCLFGPGPVASQDQPQLFEQLVGSEFSYMVQKGDSLLGIGARFGVNGGFLVDAFVISGVRHSAGIINTGFGCMARATFSETLPSFQRLRPRAAVRTHRDQACCHGARKINNSLGWGPFDNLCTNPPTGSHAISLGGPRTREPRSGELQSQSHSPTSSASRPTDRARTGDQTVRTLGDNATISSAESPSCRSNVNMSC